jgi:hypothetical protein
MVDMVDMVLLRYLLSAVTFFISLTPAPADAGFNPEIQKCQSQNPSCSCLQLAAPPSTNDPNDGTTLSISSPLHRNRLLLLKFQTPA